MSRLILSVFPGVGLLDRQFEAEGFCVVRGPDELWGGDIRGFVPPPDVFDGVIGGPPCQDFSAARRGKPTGEGVELLNEYRRVVAASRARWFVCENVPRVPDIAVAGYDVQRLDIEQAWFSGVRRLRHIQFGRRDDNREKIAPLQIPRGTPAADAEPAALASDRRPFVELCRLQGLPVGFDLPGFTDTGRKRAVGNGVPALMGRVLAAAVRFAVYGERPATSPRPTYATGRRRCAQCERVVDGRALTCSARCRKARSRHRTP